MDYGAAGIKFEWFLYKGLPREQIIRPSSQQNKKKTEKNNTLYFRVQIAIAKSFLFLRQFFLKVSYSLNLTIFRAGQVIE